jgi:RHS repeat-associated protein
LTAAPADPETRAAWLAAKHYNTPNLIHSDSLGRPFMTVTDSGSGKTTSFTTLTDPLSRVTTAFDELNREVSFGASSMTGTSMYSRMAEKGEKWLFQDALNRIVKLWNGAGLAYRFSYDKVDRVVSTFITQDSTERLVSHIVYGETLDAGQVSSLNMKGQLYQHYDQSGLVTNTAIDFKGNITRSEKRLTSDYKQIVNWASLDSLTDIGAINAAAAPLLEAETFVASSSFDALNRPTSTVLPDNSVIRPTYNEANRIESLDVQLQGQGDFMNFLAGQDYDAKGQRQFATFGNGTITRYFYDPFSFRLTNLLTNPTSTTDPAQALQNITYTYDPVGNITELSDAAQQTYFFRNAVVLPDSTFEYDATYQLLQATGREHAGLGTDNQRDNNDFAFISQLPEANDSGAVRNYTEQYTYDDCGNILSLRHIAAGSSWTQRYRYQYQDDPANDSNRLKATSLPGDADGVFSAAYAYSTEGNMSSMPHLPTTDSMVWDYAAQLKQVNLGGGGMAYYVYSDGSQRTRKIIERIGGKKIQRIYLGPVEIYRESQGAGPIDLQRLTVSVSDDVGLIARIDTKTIDTNNSDPTNILNQPAIRYQYGNHLGSASLETDETANIISYEEYHPFGTSSYRVFKPGVDTSLKRYRFTGKERDDETGFYCFDTRYYAAWLGRWTSHDPGGFIDSPNLWAYCTNNPVNIIDPDGLEGKTIRVDHIVPADVKTAEQFDSWARSRGIWYSGTPTLHDGLWKVDYIRFPQVSLEVGEPKEGAAPAPAAPDAKAQGGGAPGKQNTEEVNGEAASDDDGIRGDDNGPPDPDGAAAEDDPGGDGGETFFDRGGATLLGGLLLLGAGLLTVATAGAATPLLVLTAGALATAGGVAVTTTSAIQLGLSYGGATTAQQDAELHRAIGAASALSSPGGLIGGAIGTGIAGQDGLETGALIGNAAEFVYTAGSWANTYRAAKNTPSEVDLLSVDRATIASGLSAEKKFAGINGVQVLTTHGEPGSIIIGRSLRPLSEAAPAIQASPHGTQLMLACKLAEDPAAVQALANETGRVVGAFEGKVFSKFGMFFNHTTGQVIDPIWFTPQTWSPFFSKVPNATVPAANAAANRLGN